MRVVAMLNNWGGLQVLKFLKQTEEVVGLVIHTPKKGQKFTDEIIRESGLANEKILFGTDLRKEHGIEAIRNMAPDIVVCAFFQYILKKPIIEIPPKGIVNLHPSLLPYNRGWHVNEWPIIDGSPAGVTIHYIDEGIDTGDIIAQHRVNVESVDTGGSLHRKLVKAVIELFEAFWPQIKDGVAPRIPQPKVCGSYHFKDDIEKYTEIHLDETYTGLALINQLRARSYPPFPPCYFIDNNRKKTYIDVKLFYEEDLENGALPQWK